MDLMCGDSVVSSFYSSIFVLFEHYVLTKCPFIFPHVVRDFDIIIIVNFISREAMVNLGWCMLVDALEAANEEF